ncbi:MAG TPA: primosomal protein N' [Chthoniobacterales bacterium]|nr:primosomal protein N' [Chthoniobacterales bacterium]
MMRPSYVRVIIDRAIQRELDYAVPETLADRIGIGSRVRVPFRDKSALATVLATLDQSDAKGIRPIEALVGEGPALSESLLELAKWMSTYYCCPLETVMRSLLPQVIRRAEIGWKKQLIVQPPTTKIDVAKIDSLRKRAPRQAELLDAILKLEGPMPAAQLLCKTSLDNQTLRALAKRGLIELREEAMERDPHADEHFVATTNLELNEEQTLGLRKIIKALAAPETSKPVLLHGVTGSGKTEIYLQAIRVALERGRSAIVLVPEISLTPQTVERFKSRFAEMHETVAVLHSHLSEGERHDEWHKIHSGRARIAIGARSAIFAPLKDLGLIIVDEEHETTYKQEEAPRYHARDIAVVRAKIEKCSVVLGSATPSLESYHNATIGKYELATLTQRVDDQQMPLMRIVDLRQERRKEKIAPIISEKLSQAIADRLEKHEQTILFLNRRGFSTSLLCTNCGEARNCPNCSVALTFHRHPAAAGRLSCHLCGHAAAVPKKCPACGKDALIYAGFGTEKVESTVSHLFPKANVRRMDADSMTRKEAYRETLRNFRVGKIDILVGTQMIAKGLHFPNVTLVGIINADLALHLPDFRAGERTFQLLTQVAGRAGRGERPGEVFVQTYTPFSPSIQFARHHDFDGYFQQELEFRERCDFPPFKHAILITVRSEHEGRAKLSAETMVRRLRESLRSEFILGDAAPAPLQKLQGQFRFHILLRGEAIMRLSRLVRETLDKLPLPEDVIATVDVDPYQLL